MSQYKILFKDDNLCFIALNTVYSIGEIMKDFVEKEITKGMLPYPAIEKVLNSVGLEKLCPELKDDKVKRTIRTTLLNYYFKGPNKGKEIEEGER